MAHALHLDGHDGGGGGVSKGENGARVFFCPCVGVGTAGWDLNENKILFWRQSLVRFCPLTRSVRVIMRYK
jgi:hypothetical protein